MLNCQKTILILGHHLLNLRKFLFDNTLNNISEEENKNLLYCQPNKVHLLLPVCIPLDRWHYNGGQGHVSQDDQWNHQLGHLSFINLLHLVKNGEFEINYGKSHHLHDWLPL